MKHAILAAALAAFTPAVAGAQQSAMPAASARPMMTPAQRQQMRAMRTQFMQMHRQLRSQVLSDLTPAHKALLSQVAGQLAVSPDPNFDAAANQLDAALSADEKQKIVSAAQSMRSRLRSMVQSMPLPPMGGRGMMERRGMRMENGRMTAGGIVLMLAVGHGPEMMGPGMMRP
jgi:hypothetical protein